MAMVFIAWDCSNSLLQNFYNEDCFSETDIPYIDKCLETVVNEVVTRVLACINSIFCLTATAVLIIPSFIIYNIDTLTYRGFDPVLILKINILFCKAVLIGVLSTIGAIISPQLVFNNLEALRKFYFSVAELTAETTEIQYLAHSLDFSRLPDHGLRLYDHKEEFAAYLGNCFLNAQNIMIYELDMDEVLIDYLQMHYTPQEIDQLIEQPNIQIINDAFSHMSEQSSIQIINDILSHTKRGKDDRLYLENKNQLEVLIDYFVKDKEDAHELRARDMLKDMFSISRKKCPTDEELTEIKKLPKKLGRLIHPDKFAAASSELSKTMQEIFQFLDTCLDNSGYKKRFII